MEGLRAETSVAELCRQHNIAQSQFYSWNKEFMEAGKKRLNGDVIREATSDEVSDLKKRECPFERNRRFGIAKWLRICFCAMTL